MPRLGHAWWHVMWHTYGTWLPGDPRGFRDRDHRIHSSGDYKKPPPQREHEGLYDYARRVSNSEVVLATPALRREVCDALLSTIAEFQYRVLVLTVCRVHVHTVIELPEEREPFEKAMRDLKTKSSAKVINKPQSRLWARLWKPVYITDETHRNAEMIYVRDKQGINTCTWTFRDGFIRCR